MCAANGREHAGAGSVANCEKGWGARWQKAFAALGVGTLAAKAMPDLDASRRLGVSLKLRPVIRVDRRRGDEPAIATPAHGRRSAATPTRARAYGPCLIPAWARRGSPTHAGMDPLVTSRACAGLGSPSTRAGMVPNFMANGMR